MIEILTLFALAWLDSIDYLKNKYKKNKNSF